MVTVELRNEAKHPIYVKCGDPEVEQLRMLTTGETISWEFREILFPLKWCYVYVKNDTQGVFWASHVRLQCTHCIWRIRNDGIYYYKPKLQEWIKRHLYQCPILNVDV
ncbi:hypothetical protein Patl1_01470 [Pistacia atlantica]|uniref:Uncharacterized protein n=1 Tax=Pistacia atlantica TaxID=434234 RepID=A0ACC1CC46_9ROSI|nr:hypothetical protein Patl1_01470 [Pistacia atlantica]